MTREVAHFQMFEAALATIQPNFPPGVLQSDPRHSNTYFNMSSGAEARGPWNDGSSTQLGETWQYIADPLAKVDQTNGLQDLTPTGTDRTLKSMEKADKAMSKVRSEEVKSATPMKDIQWSAYGEDKKEEQKRVDKLKKN